MDGFCNQNADQLGSLARLSFPADVDVSVVECAPASPYTYSSSTGQPSPHKPRLVVSHSTCPPLSSSPHAYSFVLGTAVINNNNNPHGKFHLAGVTPKSKVIQAGVPRPSSTWLTAFRAFQKPTQSWDTWLQSPKQEGPAYDENLCAQVPVFTVKMMRRVQLVPADMRLEFSESNLECRVLRCFSVNFCTSRSLMSAGITTL